MAVYDLRDIGLTHAPLYYSGRSFHLMDGQRTNDMTRGGEIISTGGNPRLWYGTYSLAANSHDAQRGILALLRSISEESSCVLLSDPTFEGLNTASARLQSVNASDTSLIRISGIGTSRFVIGDYISFGYGGGRRAFHQIAQNQGAPSGGVTPWMKIVPPLREGYTADGTVGVTTRFPVLAAKIVPGSIVGGDANGGASDGVSFDWIQTLESVA